MELGTAIKKIRKESGLGQKDLATGCNMSVNAISLIETNISFPHPETIKNICYFLKIPVAYLLFFSISEEDIPKNSKIAFKYLSAGVKEILLDGLNNPNK